MSTVGCSTEVHPVDRWWHADCSCGWTYLARDYAAAGAAARAHTDV